MFEHERLALAISVRGLLSVAAIAIPVLASRAQCADWTGTFYPGGTSDPVYAQAVYDDGQGPALYVAGRFVTAGATAANRVVKRTSAGWSALGSGLTGDSTARVQALAVFDDGSGAALYAAGHFDAAGGSPATNIAKWNGTSWSALGDGLTRFASPGAAEVLALAVFDDGSGPALYAGGYFDWTGSIAAYNIAKWNGVSWSDVGGGGTSGRVRALTVYDAGVGPRLYAGGEFQQIDGLPKRFLARWTGATWAAVPGAATWVFSLAVHDDGGGPKLFIGGFTSAGGVATWDGTSVTTLPALGIPASMTTFDDGLTGPSLYAAGSANSGQSFIKRWTGSSWAALSSPSTPDAPVRSLCVFDDGAGAELYVGGDFNNIGSLHASFLARWSGALWTKLGPSNSVDGEVFGLGVFDAGSGDELYVGGNFARAGDASAFGVARWDGGNWADLAGSMPPANLAHDFATWDDGTGEALYCGGNFLSINNVPGANKVARWNGVSWSKLGTGVASNPNPIVRALATFDDGAGAALYAGGSFNVANGAVANAVAKWNGASWSALGLGAGSNVRALATFDDGSGAQLFAGGYFGSASGATILRWDGSTWSTVGGGTDGNPHALCVFDDGSGAALYAGGDFDNAGGSPASNVARWDGAGWTALGSGCNGLVEDLAVFDDGRGAALYVAGNFTVAGGLGAQRIARWDGANWEALGAGVDGDVNALEVFDDGSGPALFLGGAFLSAGGRPSSFLAKWSRVCCPPATYCTAGLTSSFCLPSIGGVGTPSASASSGFTIRIESVEGQKTGHIFYGLSGAIGNPWSPSSSSFLCVKAPSQRTPTQNSNGTDGGCDGLIQIDWLDYVATHPGSLGVPFSAGTQVWAQLYFRDPAAPKTTNLSNGLTFVLCP